MMQRLLLPFFIIWINAGLAQEPLQLAPPLLKYHSVYFSDTARLEILFDMPGAAIRYTLNGREPLESDQHYKNSMLITKDTEVRVKTFAAGFQPSETKSVSFIRSGLMIQKVSTTMPSEKYSSNKLDILFDNRGGNLSIQSGEWLGFDTDTVTIDIELIQNEKVSEVLPGILCDEGSWIFLPEKIEVQYYDEKQKKYVTAAIRTFSNDAPAEKHYFTERIKLEQSVITSNIRMIIQPVKNIPGWHAGKGKHGWFFIDEIKLY